MTTPAADDFAAIAARIAELEAERAAAEKARAPVDEPVSGEVWR